MTKSKLPKLLIAGHYLSSKRVAKSRRGAGGETEDLFFSVNLGFSLNTAAHRMQEESLPIAEGHDPTTSAVAAIRNS